METSRKIKGFFMKKVALHNLGCKVNSYEMEVMQQRLTETGYEIVPFDQVADVYVINTCSVTNIADRKSRQMIHKAKQNNPQALVVAAGCYVQGRDSEEIHADGVDIIVGNNKKSQIVELLDAYFEDKAKMHDAVIDINATKEYDSMTLKKPSEHTRAFIKIQDGCNCFCSYCIIPFVRGRERSREISDIEKEVTLLAERGCAEIVLTGIHLSSYGRDNGSSLLEVIDRVSKIEGIERIRLGSLEPQIITEEFVKALADNRKFCPHFHLSLQSGCDSVLKRMNRHYSAEDFYQITELLRKHFDDPALTTDVIVGFPGESEEEFAKTFEFLKKVKFYETHIFKYSKRAGTNAAKMQGQLTEKQKTERANVLSKLNEENKKAYIDRHVGKELEVLLEEEIVIDGKTMMTGYSKEYIKCNLQTSMVAGEIAKIVYIR